MGVMALLKNEMKSRTMPIFKIPLCWHEDSEKVRLADMFSHQKLSLLVQCYIHQILSVKK